MCTAGMKLDLDDIRGWIPPSLDGPLTAKTFACSRRPVEDSQTTGMVPRTPYSGLIHWASSSRMSTPGGGAFLRAQRPKVALSSKRRSVG